MKTTRPAPAGQGTYSELGEDANFGDIIVDSITSKSNIEYEYPEIPYSPDFVYPFRDDLIPTAGDNSVTFTRSTKASWTDYDGVLRWSQPDAPRFTGVRWENGAPKTTTLDGMLIPDDASYLGTIMTVGDSQGGNAHFPDRLEISLLGLTVVDTNVGGQTLETIASEIVARLESYSPDIVVIEGGYNDIIGLSTGAEMLGWLDEIITACLQHGAKPIILEITPFNTVAGWQAGWQAHIDTYNTGIETRSSTYGYSLIKLNQIFEDVTTAGKLSEAMGQAVYDGLHWGDLGQNTVTEEIMLALNPVFLRGLLIEDSTENSALYSQDFTNAAWDTNSGSTVVSGDSTASPDLTVTADTITAAAVNGTLLQPVTLVSADYCFSIWLKRKTGTGKIYITMDGGVTLTPVNVSDSWIRFSTTNEAANPSVGIQIANDTDAVYAYGGQLETGTYPTSYFISVASAETRAKDIASIPTTGMSSKETSKVVTISPLWSTQQLFDIDPGSAAGIYYWDFSPGNNEAFRLFGKITRLYKYDSSSGTQFLAVESPRIGQVGGESDTSHFIAKIGYTASEAGKEMIAYNDGGTNDSMAITSFRDTAGTTMHLGSQLDATNQADSHLKNLIIYNKVLSAEQMQEVTSW
jgi:lysophospholipase L1-like esterase